MVCKLFAGAAITLLTSAALAQDAPAQAPARQPADQRRPRDGERRPEGQPADGRQDARRASGEITSVESAMRLINRSVRRLKNQISDAEKKEENIKLVGDIERAIVIAKSMPLPDLSAPRGPGGRGPGRGQGGEPGPRANEGTREQPGGSVRPDPNAAPDAQPDPKPQPKDDAKQPERKPEPADPKKTEEFRRELMKLLRQALDVEQDLMDGKLDQAKTDLNKLPETRDEAHKELGVRQGRDDR